MFKKKAAAVKVVDDSDDDDDDSQSEEEGDTPQQRPAHVQANGVQFENMRSDSSDEDIIEGDNTSDEEDLEQI